MEGDVCTNSSPFMPYWILIIDVTNIINCTRFIIYQIR